MPSNSVVWFEIYVQDMRRAQKFYESVLGVKLTELKAPVPGLEMQGFPHGQDRAGAGGALVKMKEVPSGGNSTLVYFACEDCGVEAGRVVGAGGRIFREKMSIAEHGFIALAFDTEGNMFGLHSMK